MINFRIYGVILLVIFSCGIFCFAEDKDPEDRFWNWVLENEDMIYDIDETKEDQLAILDEKISMVNEEIGFLIGKKNNEEKRPLVLTAYGNLHNFPVIDKLYAKKPDLKKLDIIKYIPRGGFIEPLYLLGEYIRVDDIGAWIMREDDGRISIVFCSSRFDMDYANLYLRDLYNYILAAIGEYDITTKINKVDIEPVNLMGPEVIPLYEFQEVFDRLFM